MRSGWLAAGVAFALGAAIAVVALPARVEEPTSDPVFLDDAELVAARVRETGIAERPEWRLGDAWRVQFNDGEPVCWMVVADVTDGYRQGIACETDEAEEIAVNLAVWQEPWAVAYTRDLEGVGDGESDATRWFDWPLEDGKTWSTSYLESDVTVRATLVDGAFALRMTFDDGGDDLARYDYDPALKWWSEIRFDSGFVLRVHEREPSWNGPVVVADAEAIFGASSNFAAQFTKEFATDEDDDYLVLVESHPRGRLERWELTSSRGDSYSSLDGPMDEPSLLYELIEAGAADWTYQQVGAGLGGFRAWIYVAQVETIDL